MAQFQANFNVDQSKSADKQGKTRILVAPLDWGLGHATRCIPLIRELLSQGAEPVIGGSGLSGALLKEEFPGLTYLEIPATDIRYSRKRRGFALRLLRQYPALTRQVKAEQQWLQQAITRYQFDAVISDNRYGLNHPAIPCIIITHQLHIRSGLGRLADRIVQVKNYRQLSRFTACWIPDAAENGGLAGALSHPEKMPHIPYRYTGPLTRFSRTDIPEEKNHLLILLSGPEPQRSMLEEKILDQLHQYPGTATLVRGLPGHQQLIPSTGQIRVYNHLPAASLNTEIQRAGLIISRTGYTTLMDLLPFQKKTILIPTPGQPEQEYLGQYLTAGQQALVIAQERFSLLKAVAAAAEYRYRFPGTAYNTALTGLLAEFLQQLR